MNSGKRSNLVALGVGIVFIFVAGGAAFLTALLFGVDDTSQLIAVALISLVTSAVGAVVLVAIAYMFSQKGRQK